MVERGITRCHDVEVHARIVLALAVAVMLGTAIATWFTRLTWRGAIGWRIVDAFTSAWDGATLVVACSQIVLVALVALVAAVGAWWIAPHARPWMRVLAMVASGSAGAATLAILFAPPGGASVSRSLVVPLLFLVAAIAAFVAAAVARVAKP